MRIANSIRTHFPNLFLFVYRNIKHNKYSIDKGNTTTFGSSLIKKSMVLIKGNYNTVEFPNAKLKNCRIIIKGNSNTILIKDNCYLENVELYIEDSNNSIIIGEGTEMYGPIQLAAIEGTSIIIGEKCLFSQNISVRTGDSHSILDSSTSKRINPSKDVVLKEHIWVGYGSTILKGCVIESNSVIAAGSVVVGKEYPANSVIGGNHAKVIKTDINWDSNRI